MTTDQEEEIFCLPSMCVDDTVKIKEIFEEWLTWDVKEQRRGDGGWEPAWGDDAIFNGTYQQGDCGERVCSRKCAEVGSGYLNKWSKYYIVHGLTQIDGQGIFRGGSLLDENGEPLGWCEKYCARTPWSGCNEGKEAGTNVDVDLCDMCYEPASSHRSVNVLQYLIENS